MSDFFNPNDFGEWKKVTKAISDHLRDFPNTSNPAKLMHVIADKFGFDDTKAFKSHLDKLLTPAIQEFNAEAIFQLGSYEQICKFIDNQIPEAKGAAVEKREKAIWIIKKLAFMFYASDHNSIKANFSYLSFLENLKATKIADQSRRAMKRNHPDNLVLKHSKELNIWYSSLPGSPHVKPGEYFWDHDPDIKKTTLNAIEREIKPVLWPLIKKSDDSGIDEYKLFKTTFDSMLEFILSYVRYAKTITSYFQKTDFKDEIKKYFDLIYIELSQIDAQYPNYLDQVLSAAPIPFNYKRTFYLKLLAVSIVQKFSDELDKRHEKKYPSTFEGIMAKSRLNKMHGESETNECKISEKEQANMQLFSDRFIDTECIEEPDYFVSHLAVKIRYVFLISHGYKYEDKQL